MISMEQTFQFKIGLGYSPDIMLLVEIPTELHERICQYVGDGQMARFEFGFHFQEVIQRQFPKLDQLIHEKIDEWISEHYLNGCSKEALHTYSLQSSWFEELEGI